VKADEDLVAALRDRLRRLDAEHDALGDLLAKIKGLPTHEDSSELFELAMRIDALQNEFIARAVKLIDEMAGMKATDPAKDN
jgi:hypothetical protein